MGTSRSPVDHLRIRRTPIRLTREPAETSTDLLMLKKDHGFDVSLARSRSFGFVQQLRGLIGSLFLLFGILGLIGLFLGLAVFYFGVVLPFGLA